MRSFSCPLCSEDILARSAVPTCEHSHAARTDPIWQAATVKAAARRTPYPRTRRFSIAPALTCTFTKRPSICSSTCTRSDPLSRMSKIAS